jgi:hypothetical protein
MQRQAEDHNALLPDVSLKDENSIWDFSAVFVSLLHRLLVSMPSFR